MTRLARRFTSCVSPSKRFYAIPERLHRVRYVRAMYDAGLRAVAWLSLREVRATGTRSATTGLSFPTRLADADNGFVLRR
jgi:hypothetical protein